MTENEAKNKFTYHIVNIKPSINQTYEKLKEVFTYHIVNIKP